MFDLQPMEPLAGGQSGDLLFRVRQESGEPAVLKCRSGPNAGDLAEEARRLDWLRKRTSVPRVLTLGRVQDSCWFTMTLLAGTPGHELPEALRETAARELAAALRHLHSQPWDKCPFDQRLDAQLARAAQLTHDGLVDEDDFDDERKGRSAADLLAQAIRERPAAEDVALTHGDCCLPNVLFHEDGRFSGFVDCGRAGVADHHQDLALAVRSLQHNWGAELAERFLQAYGRDRADRARLAYYALLDEFF